MAPPTAGVIGQVRTSIAIFSYDGGLYFGVTGDYDSSGDVDLLTAGVERAMNELLRATPKRKRTTQVGGSSRARSSAPRA